jgi:hypothetical protein
VGPRSSPGHPPRWLQVVIREAGYGRVAGFLKKRCANEAGTGNRNGTPNQRDCKQVQQHEAGISRRKGNRS